VQSKGRLFENQESSDVAILNAQDKAVSRLEGNITGQHLYFNVPQTSHGAVVRDKEMVCNLPGKSPAVFSLAGFGLKGAHNVENAAAASLAALVAGGNESGIQAALDTYEGLHHRMELVKIIGGVHYYNDSKATNVDAVKRSLESFDANVILIMGGRDKGGSYTVLEALIRERVKRLIAMGEARENILKALGGLTRTEETGTLDEAVRLANQATRPGDIVLLSPGCSSFDQFTDYAERGEAFVEAIEALTIEN
ncbi:MAG: UDP-N-acetylmuramoyl-L-alanine--D-glutamate ligase, partial [Deltaproteobacteria bacterium]|nr:UDP-N-acetylmuramoyl-L-alanine--D-glutamate ligase [Deltaproteobacteria bacterium]